MHIDTGNLNIDQIYNIYHKSEPITNEGNKALQNHQGTKLNTRPREIAAVEAHKIIITQ